MPSDIENKGDNTVSLGTDDMLVSDFSLTRNLEGDNTERGTITYVQKGKYSVVKSQMPELGSTSKHFPNGSVLQSATITSEPSNAWKVVLTYFPPSIDETSLSAGGRTKDFSLSVSSESRSILLHPNYYEKIPEPFLFYLDKLCKGASPSDLVYPPKEKTGDLSDNPDETLDTSESKIPIEDAMKKCDDATAQKCYEYIKKGVTSYSVTRVAWTETEYSSSRPSSSSLSKVGKIASPLQAPSFGTRNWRLTDVNSSADKNTKYWKTTWTYTLSDEGAVWDQELYG